jgi:hypothetical protein
MYTRGPVVRNYTVYTPEYVATPGFVQTTMKDKILQTWAIVRPSSGFDPNGAPFYLGPSRQNQLIRGGAFALTPAKPRVMMDPSDKTTWQRAYLFTN